MNNNYTIAQRNALVEKYLWCIDTVIRKNRPLMRAAQLEYDDVYQQLALRLIKAVAGFDPQKGTLQQHICLPPVRPDRRTQGVSKKRYGLA